MRGILCRHYKALATDRWDIGCIDGYEYRIPLKPGAKPVYTMPYNLSQPDQEVMDEFVEELLAKGVISPYEGVVFSLFTSIQSLLCLFALFWISIV